MELWTDKYKPKTLSEMIGNDSKLKLIHSFFKNFKNPKAKKILLLSGPPGIGKTTAANLALKEYNYNIIEFNASSIRGPKNIRDIFDKVLGYNSVIDMFKNGTMPTGIIMDEIDTLCSGGDKGGMTEFLNIIKSRKTKDEYNINNPIICTYNEFSDKKLKELKNLSVEIKMSKPNVMNLEEVVNRIEKEEGMNIEPSAKSIIIQHSMGDIRRLINILYDIYMVYKSELITLDIVEIVVNTFVKKDVDIQIFDITRNILNTPLSNDELLNYYDSDRLQLPMMLHENYINSIYNKDISVDEKFRAVLECADAFVENDIYQTFIYDNQSWEISDTMSLTYALKMNEIGRMKKSFVKTDKIQYTVLLNRISQYHTNKKMINTLSSKLNLNLSFDDMYFLSEMVVFHLFNKSGDINNLVKIMKMHNLSIDHIDLLIRINKLNNNEIKSKYTIKIKKELQELLKK
jgi:replication factor C subunit 1